MANRWFIVPCQHGPGLRSNHRTVKYFDAELEADYPGELYVGADWTASYPGRDSRWALVKANVNGGQRNALAALPDVFAFPADLRRTPTSVKAGELNDLFELVDIPLEASALMSWRAIIRRLLNMNVVQQRHAGLHRTMIADRRLDDPMTAQERAELHATRLNLGYPIAAGTTRRQLLARSAQDEDDRGDNRGGEV